MLRLYVKYKPLSSCRTLFWYGGRPRQFICMENFRVLVVPGGGFHKGIIIQYILAPKAFLPNGQAWFKIKGNVTRAYVHAPRERNSPYGNTVRNSLYKTRWPKYPRLKIHCYKLRPQGPTLRPHHKPKETSLDTMI